MGILEILIETSSSLFPPTGVTLWGGDLSPQRRPVPPCWSLSHPEVTAGPGLNTNTPEAVHSQTHTVEPHSITSVRHCSSTPDTVVLQYYD